MEELQEIVNLDLENLQRKDREQAEVFVKIYLLHLFTTILLQSAENKFNLVVDKLRQQPNEQQLKKTLDEAFKILNSLNAMYANHEKAELATVNKYLDYINIEIDILQTEIKRFLTRFVIDPFFDPKNQRKRASKTDLMEDPDDALVGNAVYYCQYEANLLKNWEFG